MEFSEVIRTRRSVRKFSDKEIPEDVITRVMDSARIAPSGNNRQPWSFVVVRDPERRQKIASACYNQSYVAKAPVVVVCCAQPYPNRYEPWEESSYMADAIIAIDHLVLAARNEGLGACWVGAVGEQGVKEAVNIPDPVKVLIVVPLGYPESETAFNENCNRKALSEICFKEEYGKV